MPRTAFTQLMFQGTAEEAVALYAEVFPDCEVSGQQRWAAGEPGKEGAFKLASLRLAGHEIRIFDSPTPHAFDFTPSVSLFVECESEEELDTAFERLAAGGQVFMPVGSYGFSRRFGWAQDRFGVSWQLNLA